MRTRAINPGFYKDEDLTQCSAMARLLYPALWMIADREGVLEDRPRRIKIEVFPCDDVDCDALLGELERHGMIVRYQAGGRGYIYIPSFKKYQRPHPHEAKSALPPPPSGLQDGSRNEISVPDGECHEMSENVITLHDMSRNVSECPSSLQASKPSSLSSLSSPQAFEPSVKDQGQKTLRCSDAAAAETQGPKAQGQPPGPETFTASGLMGLWNRELAPLGFPAVAKVSPSRERHFRARLADDGARASPGWWEAVVAKMAASRFMRESAAQKKNWLCLDWLLNESNLVKVLEGKYDGAPYEANAPPPPTQGGVPDPREIKRRFEEKYGKVRTGGDVIDV